MIRPLLANSHALADGETISLAPVGLPQWRVRREGDFLKYEKAK